MSESISLLHRGLCQLDRTTEPHSLGAPFLNGGIYVGTYRKDYPKARVRVGIEDSGIWIEREEDDADLQIVVGPHKGRKDGLEDLREFTNILVDRVIEEQKRLSRATQ